MPADEPPKQPLPLADASASQRERGHGALAALPALVCLLAAFFAIIVRLFGVFGLLASPRVAAGFFAVGGV